MTRRSISRELFDPSIQQQLYQQQQQQQQQAQQPQPRKTSARPVTRRSISRELYDVNFTPGPSPASMHSRARQEMAEMEAQMRNQMMRNNNNFTRDFDQFCMDSASILGQDRFARGPSYGREQLRQPPPLSSQGRSMTSNEFQRFQPSLPSASLRRAADDGAYGIARPMMRGCRYGEMASSLDERNRGDWRRISVPERGKDFKSLPRKYNR